MKRKEYIKMPVICIAMGVLSGCLGINLSKKELAKSRPELRMQGSVYGANGSNKMNAWEIPEYFVPRAKNSMSIDGNWKKAEWKAVKSLEIKNRMGKKPLFSPKTEVKMMYDDEFVYVIFRVHDKYVRSIIREFNGPVSMDAAVEFFFSPDNSRPKDYFNLEINCGGTPLIRYVPGKQEFTKEDIKEITIAHSMPEVVDPEITKRILWTIECRIPFRVLEKFSEIRRPRAGDCWRANFFKTASRDSNPHYFTWAVVESSKPNFHLPQFFGKLKFL